MNALFAQVNAALAAAGRMLQPLVLLLLRLYWGWQYFLAGKGKLADLSKPTHFFASLHIPAPAANAVVVSVSETVGGLLLMAGLGTRWFTPLFIFEMLIAFVTADREALGSIFSDPDKFTGAAPFLFLLVFVILFAFGAGPLSLDALLFRKRSQP